MQSPTQADPRTLEITKITESDVASVLQHLKEITEGAAFKGSHRSVQFLRFIVEQAIAGRFESLKERMIGVELFGRSPSYDTGDDAIVRVTASDVRKRLLQHYGKYGSTSEVCISLPLGSYIPEITRMTSGQQDLLDPAALPAEPAQRDRNLSPQDSPNSVVAQPAVPSSPRLDRGSRYGSLWLILGVLLTIFSLFGPSGIVWRLVSRVRAEQLSVPPWSEFFNSRHGIQIITSDPNIVEIQQLTGHEISVSDYANHDYVPEPNTLSREIDRICRTVLRGDKSAAIDTPIAVHIAALAQANAGKISVHAARSIQLTDLNTDDNFIFLGSPRSNPWFSIFNDQLDFRYVFDRDSGQEAIRNVHPRPHELPLYMPTALGGGTGQSFAIIALVQNPDQSGEALLLAGANAEGTEAAGNFVTDLPRFSAALQQCGVPFTGSQHHFELLLHLNTMAGSPNNVTVSACHLLPNVPGR